MKTKNHQWKGMPRQPGRAMFVAANRRRVRAMYQELAEELEILLDDLKEARRNYQNTWNSRACFYHYKRVIAEVREQIREHRSELAEMRAKFQMEYHEGIDKVEDD